MGKTERHIEELFADDPERADALAFGRKTDTSRRGFLGGAGLAAMSAAVGGAIPFAAIAAIDPQIGSVTPRWASA